MTKNVENMTKRTLNFPRIGLALGCVMAVLLAGCATSRGFGQDLQGLGRSIERNATK